MFANPFCFRYSWTTVLAFVLLVVTTNASEDATNVTDEKSSIYFPYTIEKFGVLLQSTSSISQNETDIIFTDDLVDSILAPTIQQTLYNALGGHMTQVTPLVLSHVYTEGNEQRHRNLETSNDTTNTNTTIVVTGGIVYFKTPPPVERLPGVIQTAINEKLLLNMQEIEQLAGVTSCEYVEVEEEDTVQYDESNNKKKSLNNNILIQIVLGGIAGGLFIMTAVLLLIRSKQSSGDKDGVVEEADIESTYLDDTSLPQDKKGQGDDATTDHEDENGDENKSKQMEDDQTVNDTGSVVSNMSEWTSATSDTQAYIQKSQYSAAREIFQRNANVSLKKDMLESQFFSGSPARLKEIPETTSESSGSNRCLV